MSFKDKKVVVTPKSRSTLSVTSLISSNDFDVLKEVKSITKKQSYRVLNTQSQTKNVNQEDLAKVQEDTILAKAQSYRLLDVQQPQLNDNNEKTMEEHTAIKDGKKPLCRCGSSKNQLERKKSFSLESTSVDDLGFPEHLQEITKYDTNVSQVSSKLVQNNEENLLQFKGNDEVNESIETVSKDTHINPVSIDQFKPNPNAPPNHETKIIECKMHLTKNSYDKLPRDLRSSQDINRAPNIEDNRGSEANNDANNMPVNSNFYELDNESTISDNILHNPNNSPENMSKISESYNNFEDNSNAKPQNPPFNQTSFKEILSSREILPSQIMDRAPDIVGACSSATLNSNKKDIASYGNEQLPKSHYISEISGPSELGLRFSPEMSKTINNNFHKIKEKGNMEVLPDPQFHLQALPHNSAYDRKNILRSINQEYSKDSQKEQRKKLSVSQSCLKNESLPTTAGLLENTIKEGLSHVFWINEPTDKIDFFIGVYVVSVMSFLYFLMYFWLYVMKMMAVGVMTLIKGYRLGSDSKRKSLLTTHAQPMITGYS